MIILGCFEFQPKELRMMNYCSEIDGFTKYTLSNPKIISANSIRPRLFTKKQSSFEKWFSWKIDFWKVDYFFMYDNVMENELENNL